MEKRYIIRRYGQDWDNDTRKYVNRFRNVSWGVVDEDLFLYKDDFNNEKNFIESLLNTEGNYIGNTIYTSKISNIPRYKLKEYLETSNKKKTRDLNKADTIFIDKNALMDVYNHWYKNSIKKTFIEVLLTKELYDKMVANDDIGSHYGDVPYISQKHIGMYLLLSSDKSFSYPNYIDMTNIVEGYELYSYRTQNKQDVRNILLTYRANPKANIVWDDYVLEQITSDGLEWDKDYVNTLDNMFQSGELENIKLAVEMLSNINLEKYGVNVAFFLNKYKNYFNSQINTQAFKTLDKYFTSKKIYWKTDFRVFYPGMYNQYAENEEIKNTIKECIIEELNRMVNTNRDLTFSIKDINLQLVKK